MFRPRQAVISSRGEGSSDKAFDSIMAWITLLLILGDGVVCNFEACPQPLPLLCPNTQSKWGPNGTGLLSATVRGSLQRATVARKVDAVAGQRFYQRRLYTSIFSAQGSAVSESLRGFGPQQPEDGEEHVVLEKEAQCRPYIATIDGSTWY